MNRIGDAMRIGVLVAPALFGLAGCSNFGANQGTFTCPSATTVPDLQTIARLAPGGTDEDVQTAGRIASVSSTCGKDDAGVATYLTIEFSALRTGPNIKHIDLPYFVAIADSTGNILGKQQFNFGLDFPANAPTMRSTETVTAHLPLKNPQLGNVYTVIVGFQLDKNQVDFNRAHLQ
jgi:hypothetical protein